MILVIYLLTPFTMTHSIHLFQGFRVIQTRMMVLAVIHGLRPNQMLKSILEGCTDLTHLWGSTLHTRNLFSRPFFQSQGVYLRFTHIVNMQPKFYIGSAMHHTLDREYSRSRKYLQLTNERLVQAELALRYWREHDNLYIWAPIPIYTERVDYRSLEMAIIQEWQLRLNYPFICQFFHPRKGILKKPALTTNAQFGLATLWRRAKHKFTPQLVRQILSSTRFQNRLELWTIIHALQSNTKARFEQTKMLRSNDGGLTLCYALRHLANNIQEAFRTLSLNAIDASIKWWNGKRLHVPLHSGPHGPSLQTSNYISNSFYGSGIYRFWPTKFHAIHHLSRWSSSNMQLFSTNYAITSRQSLTGPRHNRQYAVAKTGEPSKQQLSIHQTRIGSWQVPFFTPWSLKSSRS